MVADDLVLLDEQVARASSQSANRSWRSARTALGSASYAVSRISRCRNRKASSPGSPPVGSHNLLADEREQLAGNVDQRRRRARAPSRRRGGRPDPRPRRARSRPARRGSARRGAPGAAPGSSAARRPCRALRARAPPSPRGRAGCPRRSPGCAPASRRRARGRRGGRRRAGGLSAASGSSRIDVALSLPAAPARPDVEELGSRDAEQEDRRGARPVDDVLDEVEHRRLRPVQVVDHEHERPLAARPSRSARVASCVSAGEDADRVRRLDAELDQHLDERPVGDPLPVRERAATRDGRACRPRARGSPRRASTCRCPPAR